VRTPPSQEKGLVGCMAEQGSAESEVEGGVDRLVGGGWGRGGGR